MSHVPFECDVNASKTMYVMYVICVTYVMYAICVTYVYAICVTYVCMYIYIYIGNFFDLRECVSGFCTKNYICCVCSFFCNICYVYYLFNVCHECLLHE